MRAESGHDNDRGFVHVAIRFDERDLQLAKTPYGTTVELKDARPRGSLGGPALPSIVTHVAMPAQQWPKLLSVENAKYIEITREPTFVKPIQPPRAGISSWWPTAKSEPKAAVTPEQWVKASTARQRDERQDFPQPFVTPPIEPPNPHLYEQAIKSPPPLARPLSIEQIGPVNVARIEINPVRLSPNGHLELCVSFDLRVSYQSDKPLQDKAVAHKLIEQRLGRKIDSKRLIERPLATVVSQSHARNLSEVALGTVLNPAVIENPWVRWPFLDLPSEYLIVTDDKEWNETTMKPGAARPGLIKAFERLAQWKRGRGISARVVTITDIVNGAYGDFKSGSRDLQEVIRKFLKNARERWGVVWLLLGGDLEIVPIRRVAGGNFGFVAPESSDPPKEQKSYWTGSYLKAYAVSLGDWWQAATSNLLVRPDTGALIPYDAAGTSSATSPGWYFVDATYTTRSATATDYVRVNGPASLVNATLQFLYMWNVIPTDFYYASLQSFVEAETSYKILGMKFSFPYVYVPERDWDGVGNGVYGQNNDKGDIDGVVNATDLSVGRASVGDATQAKTFVDKVIGYESFRGPNGLRLDQNWPRRVVLASTKWDDFEVVVATPTASNPPGDNHYHHTAGTPYSLIKLPAAPAPNQNELISEISDSDRRIIPYSQTSGPSSRGWHFATSATNLSVNQIPIPIPVIGMIDVPVPSPWIVVYGVTAELSPARFLLDKDTRDSSMNAQEQLRTQLHAELPGWDTISRLYEEELELTPAEETAAPVAHLTSNRLRDALNAAPHIVSLSGHGTGDGCCGGSVGMAQNLTNGYPFIGYADSCLTNQVDTTFGDAFSEELVNNPSGGAVAYVGNTRFSWIDVGDDFQRAFFHRLKTTTHLGLLNDSRTFVFGTTGHAAVSERWSIFALNLIGCPEMPVRRGPPRLIEVRVPGPPKLGPIYIEVVEVWPPKPIPDPSPIEDVLVHLRQGDKAMTARTDAQGRAYFDLSSLALGDIEITASGATVATQALRTTIAGPKSIRGVVTEVAYHGAGEDHATVRIATPEGQREHTIRSDHPHYRLILDAMEKSFLAREAVTLTVDHADGGAIEQFRFVREASGGEKAS